jgi:23S rRNA (guanine2445-N2)-methyltransferase / 23S rRNA (guanine2069-N7)-methyltransferase
MNLVISAQNNELSLFVSCPKGLAYALEAELQELGASATHPLLAGVLCQAGLGALYRIVMWSRIANRVGLQLSDDRVASLEDVYQSVYRIDWPQLFDVARSIAVEFSGTTAYIDNTAFGAMKVKDAIVDRFRAVTGQRPSVDRKGADIVVMVRLHKGRLSVVLDLVGDSLHKRGYRLVTGLAPLKENLAAGLLRLAGWPRRFTESASLVDPMCGSATLLIEAAMIATDRAPGLMRCRWSIEHWSGHAAELWAEVREQARARFEAGKAACTHRFFGFDTDAEVIARAWQNIQNAGFDGLIHVERKAVAELGAFERMQSGLVLTNPPYGERLGEVRALQSLYQQFGERLAAAFEGWQAGVFTGNVELGKMLGWHSHKQYKLYNGALPSQLILIDLVPQNRRSHATPVTVRDWLQHPGTLKVFHPERAQMLRNRLLKNQKALRRWSERERVSCFRLYDADMPEFAFALDLYTDVDGVRWLHIQEYAAPKSIDPASANERLREAICICLDVLEVPVQRCALKRREIKKGVEQYQKQDVKNATLVVEEGGLPLQVNLFDYLDTGLFLDHRPVRRWIRQHAADARFLNLFCYTATVTVNAAAGGARSSLSIDLSNTYLRWAQENFALNSMSAERHRLLQADCLAWLRDAPHRESFDLILLDPPSFSNSKRMEGILDVQRDHVELIELAMRRLDRGGTLVFSNNLRRFALDESLSQRFDIEDWSAASIDPDYQRNTRIHQCWMIRHRD